MRYLRLPDGTGIPADCVRVISVKLEGHIEISFHHNDVADIYTINRAEYQGDPVAFAASLMDQVERLTGETPASSATTMPPDLVAKLMSIQSDLLPAVESQGPMGFRVNKNDAISRLYQGFRDLCQLIEELRCQTLHPTG